MKKNSKIVGIIFLLVFVLMGCSHNGDGDAGKDAASVDKVCLKKLEVYSNAQNSEQIYHISYPYYFYGFTTEADGSVRSGLFDLLDPVEPAELSGQEKGAEYFVEYVKSLPEEQTGENVACYVICRYTDEEGNEESIYRKCYDAFPEGWQEFTKQCNRICGGEYLSGEGQLQALTPEFLTEIFGVTDEDVREGTLQTMIDLLKLDMQDVTGLFQIEEALNGYYTAIKEPFLEPHRPTELVSVDSTQEEYEAFLEQFFEKIGAKNVTEEDSDQKYFRRFYRSDTESYFYTARTEEIDNLPTAIRSTGGYYFMELDAHMEDMVMGVDFVYSADERFILVPMENDPDLMIAFCE